MTAAIKSYVAKRDEWGTGYAFSTLEELLREQEDHRKMWTIKGIIAWGETSAWIGPPGSMKSALMADLAVHVAFNRDWHGKRAKGACSVMYFALERADLVRRRLEAQIATLGLSYNPGETGNIIAVASTIDLFTEDSVKKVIRTVQNAEAFTGDTVGILIFDTFAKLVAASGGDEDKAKDQGKIFANIERIKEKLGRPHVAIVGHTGKDETRGSRGSNAILGDADVMVTISGDAIKTATVTKANDMPEGPLFSFKSEVHEFGVDEDGDPITVNIVSAEQPETLAATAREPKLTANQKTMFAMLHTAGKSGLLLSDWNDQAREAGIGIKRKADLNDIRNALLSKGLVRQYGDRWSVKHA